MKDKNTRKRNIRRNGLRVSGRRNRVRRSFSRKAAVTFVGQTKAIVKALPADKNNLTGRSISPPVRQSEAGQKNHLRLAPKPEAAATVRENSGGALVVVSPASNILNGHPAEGNGASGNRWSSPPPPPPPPRVSGLIAAVLLLAMLAAAALSSVARAGEEPMELASAQTGSLKLSKEYVYAGSRMLAIEDYGLSTTPTPTPTATPTDTPTPPPSACPTGYTSLGGIIIGNPTAAVFNNSLFVFVKATGSDIFYRKSSDGGNFDNYAYLGGYLTSDPASVVTNGALYLEGAGSDNTRSYRATTDGVNFSAWTNGTVGAQTTASVSFNGSVYTFVKGDGAQPPLCMNVTTGGNPTPTPPPGAPTGLRADVISPTQINLYWDANPAGENVTGYNVRMNGSQVLTNFIYTSYPFTGLAPATTYTFDVAAVNSSGGVSGWSSPVSGTTAQPPTPTPTATPIPESYTVQASQPNSSTIRIDWTSTVSRPANTDIIRITRDDANNTQVYSNTTAGGTSGTLNITQHYTDGDYTVHYLKDGTTEVTSDFFTILH